MWGKIEVRTGEWWGVGEWGPKGRYSKRLRQWSNRRASYGRVQRGAFSELTVRLPLLCVETGGTGGGRGVKFL